MRSDTRDTVYKELALHVLEFMTSLPRENPMVNALGFKPYLIIFEYRNVQRGRLCLGLTFTPNWHEQGLSEVEFVQGRFRCGTSHSRWEGFGFQTMFLPQRL